MSVRRHDIEGQAKRLRLFVSEAVRAETGEPLPMTQTLDQMVRAAAKAGVSLHFSTESQADAVQKIHGEVLQLKAENDALRKDAGRYRFVRNPLGTSSPLAIWSEGKMPLFSGMADAVVDELMAKERGQ